MLFTIGDIRRLTVLWDTSITLEITLRRVHQRQADIIILISRAEQMLRNINFILRETRWLIKTEVFATVRQITGRPLIMAMLLPRMDMMRRIIEPTIICLS